MLIKGCVWSTVFIITFYGAYSQFEGVEGSPRRILLDTDVDTDDIFALLYLLKQNKSEFNLEAVTINANAWSNAGHAVNHIYDILFMMGRDDISVGVGGEGGMQTDGTIQQDVGGYLPIIDQGISTAGGCRYRQAIPVGLSGRLEVDTNYGIRKAFLPQGARKYTPLRQATAQQVIFDKVSAGPITVFIIGAHTNIAIFLMKNPLLKKHIDHIYVMGGGHHGNLFSAYTSNPYAEFNIFGDPFAAYQVFHSGIPLTLVPLEATDTIPITREFFKEFESRVTTYEAQYCFESLKMARDTRSDEYFYTSYFMWDSFMSGVAVSIMRHSPNNGGENEFAEMKYMNITVVTSNKPYGVSDGSNPFFNGLKIPKFGLGKDGVHSGHVQTGLRDPFCLSKHGKGRCKDGYTEEVTGSGSVRVLVATRAKPNRNLSSPLDREFFRSFLDVLTSPSQSGRFNFKKQFPYYKEVLYKPDFRTKKLGKTVVFDMDMSAGDFLALFYLLKVPVEVINLKAILVSPTGWANAATIDVIYDLLHMMRRDDIAVGLGDMFPMNQSDAIIGDCKYVKAIPHGAGGLVDSDTLYGFARRLPRSPRRYTSENSVKYGAPQNTSNPELRQPLVMDVWDHVVETLPSGSKITLLANGPLTNVAKICLSGKNTSSVVEEVYVVGGQLNHDTIGKGNVFTIPSNEHAELNMFLDPLAARTVFESGLNITLIPLGVQQTVSSFPLIIERLHRTNKTPEAVFAKRLLSMLHHLQQNHLRYHHVGTFLGELLGAVIMAGDHTQLDVAFQNKPLMVIATGVESVDGQICIDEKQGKLSKVLERVDPEAYYHQFANRLGDTEQSAV